MSDTRFESPQFSRAEARYTAETLKFREALVEETRRRVRLALPRAVTVEYDLVPNEDFELSAEITNVLGARKRPLSVADTQMDFLHEDVAPYLTWLATLEGSGPANGLGLDL